MTLRTLRGVAVLLVAVVMGILATPGFDYMPRNALRTAKSQAALEKRVGAVPASSVDPTTRFTCDAP